MDGRLTKCLALDRAEQPLFMKLTNLALLLGQLEADVSAAAYAHQS